MSDMNIRQNYLLRGWGIKGEGILLLLNKDQQINEQRVLIFGTKAKSIRWLQPFISRWAFTTKAKALDNYFCAVAERAAYKNLCLLILR